MTHLIKDKLTNCRIFNTSQLKLIVFCLTICSSTVYQAHAQTFELIGGNSVNGAVTGSLIGASIMGLTDNPDLNILKIGAGAGLIYGVTVAIHDIAVLPRGQRFYISGTFNDGTNSSIIVLLDTFYGIIAGTVTGTATMLISNGPLLDGMQYGASAGAIAGFSFGLMDAFILGQSNDDFISKTSTTRGNLISMTYNGFEMGLFRPFTEEIIQLGSNNLILTQKPVIQMVNLHIPIR